MFDIGPEAVGRHQRPGRHQAGGARRTAETGELCRRCGFHPVSPRIGGYCSWDCHDADDEEEVRNGTGPEERAA